MTELLVSFLSPLLDHDIHHTTKLAVVLTVATSTFFLWHRLKKHLEQKNPFRDLPMPPNSHFFLGHLPAFRQPFQGFLKAVTVDSANEYGQTGFWMGPARPMLAVTHWEDARKVFLNESHRQRVPVFTKHLEAVARYNILTLMGREWKVQRTAIASAFKTAYDGQYRAIMVQVTQNLVAALKQKIQEQGPSSSFQLSMETTMKMCSLDVFALASMGLDLGCCKTLTRFPLAEAADFLNSEIIRRGRSPFDPYAYFYWLPCESNRKWHQAASSVKDFLGQQIQQRKPQRATNSDAETNMNLFARLIKGHAIAQEEFPGVVPDSALLDLLIAVMFAGYETTAITLCYAFYLLGKHPEIQSICLEEIQSLDKLDNPKDLVYCTGVIMEALRLYPPAVISSRTLQKPLQLLGGYTAATGTTVLLPIWTLNRNAKTWPEPNSFRPDRWVRKPTRNDDNNPQTQWVEREEGDTSGTIVAANRKAFFTFSAGARSCPGQSFALQESVLVLAGLLKEFQFTTPKGYTVVPVREGITQHPKDGIPMSVQLRNN